MVISSMQASDMITPRMTSSTLTMTSGAPVRYITCLSAGQPGTDLDDKRFRCDGSAVIMSAR